MVSRRWQIVNIVCLRPDFWSIVYLAHCCSFITRLKVASLSSFKPRTSCPNDGFYRKSLRYTDICFGEKGKMNRVIILAGGRGERLRPYTEDRPKGMVEVMGHPILLYLVRWLVSHNLRDITISCGHLHHVISDYFGDGSKYDCRIEYLVEDEPLGRGGALRRAMEAHIDDVEPMIALNGDMITNLNITDLIENHRSSGALGTVLTAPLVSPHGILDIDENGRISRFREKPELPFWISAGIYVLDRSVAARLPKKGDHEMTTFPELAQEGKLNSHRFKAFWRSIDTVKDLAEIQSEASQEFFDGLVNIPNRQLS